MTIEENKMLIMWLFETWITQLYCSEKEGTSKRNILYTIFQMIAAKFVLKDILWKWSMARLRQPKFKRFLIN